MKQSLDVRLTGFDVSDVAGGMRIDSSIGVAFDRGSVRRTRTGVIVNQLTPSAAEGFVRSYKISLSNLRMDENGDALRAAINLGSNIDGSEVCLTPPQSGEFLRAYNNIITRSGLAGILVCENAKMCVGGDGGATDLGTCTGPQDCPNGSCVAADGAGRVEIYNNTIVDDRAGMTSAGVIVRNGIGNESGPAVKDLRILNNIIANVAGIAVDISPDTVATGSVQLDRNLYFDGDGDRACLARWGAGCQQTLTSLRAATGAEPNGVEGDPAFVDPTAIPADLHILRPSAARDAGIRITEQDSSVFGKDIDGQTRSGKWDIGADEFRCHADPECDDGNLCNGAERCANGFCASAVAPLNCDDANECTIDSCKPATGCQHKSQPDDTTCDDASLCSSASTCQAGVCEGLNVTQCPAPAVCRVQATCDAATGTCPASPLAADGAICDDADRCTTGDACRAGVCKGRPCDDDPCTTCTVNGCEPVASDSFAAVICAFRRPLTPAECNADLVPNQIIEQFGAARALLEAQAGTAPLCDPAHQRAYARASYRVYKAIRRLDRTQRRRTRRPLSPTCFSLIRGVLVDARLRVQSTSGNCRPR